MKTNNLYQKVLISQLLLFSCAASYAQVVWNLKGGVAQGTEQGFLNEDEHKVVWTAGLELEIPLNDKFNLETGLRYKNQPIRIMDSYQVGITHTEEEEELNHHIELPLRLAYKLNFSDELSLHAGVGPYVSISPEGTSIGSNTFQVGIEPCVALNWKNLSLGVSYNNPCFYKGFDADYKQGVMLTLGIRFGSDAWEGIGSGLATAASVGAAVAGAYAESEGYTTGNSYSADSYSTSNSYSSDNSNSGGSSAENYLRMYENWRRKAENAYNSLAGKSGGSAVYLQNKKLLREAQQEMKKWRQKALKAGVSIPQSEWETKTVGMD